MAELAGRLLGFVLGAYIWFGPAWYIGRRKNRKWLGLALGIFGPLGWIAIALIPNATPQGDAERRPNQGCVGGFVACPICGQGLRHDTIVVGRNKCPRCGGEFDAQ